MQCKWCKIEMGLSGKRRYCSESCKCKAYRQRVKECGNSEKEPKADAVIAVARALRPTATALKSFVKAPAPTEVAPKSEASDEPAAVE